MQNLSYPFYLAYYSEFRAGVARWGDEDRLIAVQAPRRSVYPNTRHAMPLLKRIPIYHIRGGIFENCALQL
jgi:hypothetical protein